MHYKHYSTQKYQHENSVIAEERLSGPFVKILYK